MKFKLILIVYKYYKYFEIQLFLNVYVPLLHF